MARATLLLMGVVVHSAFFSRWSGPIENPEFDWFIKFSHSFRMEGFFAVAGYLMAITLPRRENYLKGRLRQLLIPLVFTWLFVLPIGWFASGGTSLRRPYDLGTLWFLVTLSISTIILYYMNSIKLNARIVSFIDQTPVYIFLSIFFIVSLASTSIANKLIFDFGMGTGLYFPLACVCSYGPYLAIGFYAFSSKRINILINNDLTILIGLISLVIYGVFLLYESGGISDSVPFVNRALNRLAVTFVSVSVTLGVLAVSLKLKTESVASSKISAAAFTIYLFHWTVLEVLHALTRGWNPWLQFIVFIPTATAICYAAHQLLIRHPVTAFMFNGRPLPPRSGRRETVR